MLEINESDVLSRSYLFIIRLFTKTIQNCVEIIEECTKNVIDFYFPIEANFAKIKVRNIKKIKLFEIMQKIADEGMISRGIEMREKWSEKTVHSFPRS